MIRQIGWLISGTIAFWAAAVLYRHLRGEEAAMVCSATAAGLCLVPTVATLGWAAWASHQSSEQQLMMVLGGTGVRMVGVLLGGWALQQGIVFFREQSGFWGWLLVFYLFTLALEVTLLVSRQSAAPR